MKKKILFVNGHLNVGGVEKSLIDILKHFNYEEYSVDLILFEDLGDYYYELPKEINIRFIDLNETYGSFFVCLKNSLKKHDWFTLYMKIILILSIKINQRMLKLLIPILKLDNKYDCAIAFRVGFCAEFVGNCIKSDKKMCWWHHGECKFDQKTKNRMTQTFYMFDKVVSVSKGCQDMIENYFESLKGKTIVIPNMIDIDTIQQKSEIFNPYINDRRQWKFITIGRFSPEKYMDNVIYISNELLKQNFNNFTWYVIGDGSEFNKINMLISEYHLEEYIKLLGSKNNPYPYIKYADILIHTSLVESQCLTVLEGLALEKPCIITESVGPREFIHHYHNGILTSSDSKEFANTIIELTQDQILFNKLINESTKSIYKQYSTNIIMNKIYASITERS